MKRFLANRRARHSWRAPTLEIPAAVYPTVFIESLIDFLSLSVKRTVSAPCVRQLVQQKRPRHRTRNC